MVESIRYRWREEQGGKKGRDEGERGVNGGEGRGRCWKERKRGGREWERKRGEDRKR